MWYSYKKNITYDPNSTDGHRHRRTNAQTDKSTDGQKHKPRDERQHKADSTGLTTPVCIGIYDRHAHKSDGPIGHFGLLVRDRRGISWTESPHRVSRGVVGRCPWHQSEWGGCQGKQCSSIWSMIFPIFLLQNAHTMIHSLLHGAYGSRLKKIDLSCSSIMPEVTCFAIVSEG